MPNLTAEEKIKLIDEAYAKFSATMDSLELERKELFEQTLKKTEQEKIEAAKRKIAEL